MCGVCEGAVCIVRAVCTCVYGMCGADPVVCMRLCVCVVCVFVVCDGHEHISSVALLHFLRLLDVGPNSFWNQPGEFHCGTPQSRRGGSSCSITKGPSCFLVLERKTGGG